MSRTFNSVRSYYFRNAIAAIDREDREYGGFRRLDGYNLEDFRILWDDATRQAITWQYASTLNFNHATNQWERRL